MEVVLIRHGQSEANARLTAELDSNLTDLGRQQAKATAAYLLEAPILANLALTVLFASPFRRTLETGKPLAEAIDAPVHALAGVCEYFSESTPGYRSFAGLSPEQAAYEFPFLVFDQIFPCEAVWWPSDLESIPLLYRRAETVRDHLYDRYAQTEMQIVIYSHAEPIGRLIEAMLRIEPSPAYPPWSENCGVSRLKVRDPMSPAELLVLDDTSHLKALGIASPVTP